MSFLIVFVSMFFVFLCVGPLCCCSFFVFFFFSSRRRHTRCLSDWSSDVCSSDLCGDETSSLVRRFFLGHMKTVSAGVFRTVERRIRTADQGLKCRDRLVSNSGADADGGTNTVGTDRRPRKLKARSNAFADFAGTLQPSWNDRDKLFTTEPGDDVVGTRARSHDLSENTQNLVAHGVAETVIDRFEVIKIEHQQGHGLAASRLLCA